MGIRTQRRLRATIASTAAVTLLGLSLSTAAAAPAAPLLGLGTQGPTVATLQRDLTELGYRGGGAPSGRFGGQTWVGLVFFQRDRHLPPTGQTDPATWAALDAALANRPAGGPLAIGRSGTAVTALQRRLLALGYTPGPLDGRFGPQTEAALRRFQYAHTLPPTGFVDPATAGALAAAPTPAFAPTPSVPPATTAAPAAQPAPTAPAATAHGPSLLGYWAAWGSGVNSMASLRRHGPALTWLSPYWYTLEATGRLRSRETDHAAVLAAAAAAHDRVLALVNDGAGLSGLLRTAAGRQQGVAALRALLAATPGLAGIMVDFESLPSSSGSDLTAFVAALRAALPATDTVGVAVGPKVSAHEPGEGLFQYARLGAVADLVQVMTYDEHDNTSAPGPVSATPWAARVAAYAASVIPPSKILLGVPAYGYDWSAPGHGTTVTLGQALALAARHGVTPQFDPVSGEDHFTYTSASGTLHTVWFESAAGAAAKRAIALRLGLRGLAVWTLGGESPGFWTALE